MRKDNHKLKQRIETGFQSAECITLLSPGDVSISIASFCLRFLSGFGEPASKWLSEKFGRYMHAGNMRYLTNCKSGDFDDVRVLYSVSFAYRLKAIILQVTSFWQVTF